MWYWLSSSKVRVGLLVNGLYLLSLILPSPAQVGGRPYARTYRERAGDYAAPAPPRALTPPAYPPLPRARGESKVETSQVREADQLEVYLKQDLTLVNELGHKLLLSPTFATRLSRPEAPRTALLRFVSFSTRQFFANDTPVLITADDVKLWRYGADSEADSTPSRAKVLHSASLDERGGVVETIGHEIPYEVFYNMLAAEKVTITLGRDSVRLTSEQVEALRDMHRRLDRNSSAWKSGAGHDPFYKPQKNH
ncbi:MAG: hypothetical protein LC795_23215 [Acidobacteria bacterium]|nr:hypothetical protein [Acidobacteriota bacterium]